MTTLIIMSAVIFISAHAVEQPEDPYVPTDITTRMIYSQLLAGRSNFENSESIQDELRFWGKRVHHTSSRKKPIQTVISDSISILNKRLPKVEHSPLLKLKPIRQQKHHSMTYLTTILERARIIADSEETKIEWYEYFWGTIDPEHPCITDFLSVIQSDTLSLVKKFELLSDMEISPNRLVRAMNFYIKELFYQTEDYETKRYTMAKPIYNKAFQLKPNFDETTDEIKNSFYGIHLLYDSKNTKSIYNYKNKPITNDNNIGGYSCTSPLDHTFLPFKPTIHMRNVTADLAIERFTFDIMNHRNGAITLRDIVDFFKEQGYTELYVIDTSCRNFDQEVWTFERISTLELIFKVNRIHKKEQIQEE